MLNSTYDYKKAKAYGLNYWIAAEFDESYMGRDAKNIEFVVGDNKTYGGYLNFGPLPPKRDFHVSLGVVSTLNQVTKVSYAKGEFFSKVNHLEVILSTFEFSRQKLNTYFFENGTFFVSQI